MTAKELFNKMLAENDEVTSTEIMIEFAKIHVVKALDRAYTMAELSNQKMFACGEDYIPIDKELVLTAYPIENIT